METTGKEFVDFWGYLANKREMNDNTAKSFAAAARQVISIDDDWETQDVSQIDVEALLRRFTNKRSKKFKPDSLKAYSRRFKQALGMFLEYAQNPADWKYKAQAKGGRKPKADDNSLPRRPSSADEFVEEAVIQKGNMTSLIEYPFRLRDDCIVRLKLPADLKMSDVERLSAYLRILVLDSN